jgi:hypothetical protein
LFHAHPLGSPGGESLGCDLEREATRSFAPDCPVLGAMVRGAAMPRLNQLTLKGFKSIREMDLSDDELY